MLLSSIDAFNSNCWFNKLDVKNESESLEIRICFFDL